LDEITVGDVRISSIIERDGPWRTPQVMFPAWQEEAGMRHLAELDPIVFDPASGKLVITYQTFVVRTPHHTILVDTCTGEDKGFPAPMDYPKQPWLDGLAAAGLGVEDIDYVFCTHLHIDHCGWNTVLRDGRWVPTFPNAKYIFHKREYAAWEAATAEGRNPPGEVWRMNCLPVVEAGQALLVDDDFSLDDTITLTPTPGHSPCHCCVNIFSKGQRAVVTGDMMHHALQCREPDWSTIFCWDPVEAAASRRAFLGSVADTSTLLLPVHFPGPTAGHVTSDQDRFRWKFFGRD
jgi:glyoxylase-like metal-dependent hydrolase (beta-lactamase superfamily II)